ncbi:MAG: aspartyl protease family protein [Bacteroidia bacterium]|nr:aspartyl protease family protein [Bacteroidia bacterium]
MLKNQEDLFLLRQKKIKQKDIRSLTINALVDTGAVMTLLPEEVIEKLGLFNIDKRIVVLADDTKRTMNIAGYFSLTVCERTMSNDCIVGPPGCEPLIGQIVLETLDLILDPLHKTISVRPESPYLPTLKLK